MLVGALFYPYRLVIGATMVTLIGAVIYFFIDLRKQARK
jgi:hypothetical protein